MKLIRWENYLEMNGIQRGTVVTEEKKLELKKEFDAINELIVEMGYFNVREWVVYTILLLFLPFCLLSIVLTNNIALVVLSSITFVLWFGSLIVFALLKKYSEIDWEEFTDEEEVFSYLVEEMGYEMGTQEPETG